MDKSGKIRQKLYELNKDFTKLTEQVLMFVSKQIDRKGLFQIEIIEHHNLKFMKN